MSIKWNLIINIIFIKYLIVFVTKENANALLSIESKYADKVLKVIDYYNKNWLVIDNRKLYK